MRNLNELIKEWNNAQGEKEVNETELMKLYKEWIQDGEYAVEGTAMIFSTDCGEAKVREDFSYCCDFDRKITYEEMAEIEANY